MRGAALALVAACAVSCGAAGRAGGADWRLSAVLDARTRGSLRAFAAAHYTFAFDVELRRPLRAEERDALAREHRVVIEGEGLDVRARSTAADLEALVSLEAVRGVSCGRSGRDLRVLDDWQQRVNAEAAQAFREDPCWIMGWITMDSPPDDARLAQLSELGAALAFRPGESSLGIVVPRDALPALVSLPFVARFEVAPAVHPGPG